MINPQENLQIFHFYFTTLIYFFVIELSAEPNSENGGWKISDEEAVGIHGPCTIKRVDANSFTQDHFIESFAYSEPVIIFNYVHNEKFRRRCKRAQMLDYWRDAKIFLNSANTYSYTRVESTFGEYVETVLKPQNISVPGNETLYLFGDISHETWKPLLDSYKIPKWVLPDHDPALSFGIAGGGTGVPFHFHGPGFGEVIHGSKRWFLQPFEKRPKFNPDKTTLDWYLNDYPHLANSEKPLECLLKTRELLYFPDKWWHATLNSETSVFMSTFLSATMSKKSGIEARHTEYNNDKNEL